MSESKSARETAEARFTAKLIRNQEALRAMSEYEADARRIDENTARLKALRLAKEAAASAAAEPKTTKRSASRRPKHK
jgi:hypothetical protein